jgi:hypothetical protein
VEDVPPLTPGEILKLIFHRMLNVKMGAFFIVLFGFFHEGTRRWPALHLWVPLLCVGLFCAAVFAIRARKLEPSALAGFAAGTFLFALMWSVATFSSAETPKSIRETHETHETYETHEIRDFPGPAGQKTMTGNAPRASAKVLQFYNPYARAVSRGFWIALGDQWWENAAMEVHVTEQAVAVSASGIPAMEEQAQRPRGFAITELKVTDDLSPGSTITAARDVLEWNGMTISMAGNKIGLAGRPKEGGHKTFRVFAETDTGAAVGDFTLHVLAHSVGLAPRTIFGSAGTAWNETVSVFVAEEPTRRIVRVTLSDGKSDGEQDAVFLDLDGLVVAVDSSEQHKNQLVIRGTPRKPGERGITVKARSTMGSMTSDTLSIDIR